ncbi:hypothetical protein M427DRAFT_459635 [Gonapodya prolifera JEL478]|uniref:Uncharacterized protein n=1 Tax=Gonapodya prolifera (strain JEL478) TaxID=1344416 RepID=A0A139A2C9_GONPJ|nr:hypothetical protein M427DRAFT_459635 [Gonapodya prolifera JEL478]|eukprot:KXS10894.1 hypothetical protein M427DRAFT_459635 [Gonapodya prolifera JEL478]
MAALDDVISKRGQRSNVKFEIAETGSVWADPDHAKTSYIGITARCVFTGGSRASNHKRIPYVPSFISMPARDSDVDKVNRMVPTYGYSFPTSLGFKISVIYCKLGGRVLILNDGVGQFAVGATIAGMQAIFVECEPVAHGKAQDQYLELGFNKEGEGFAQVAAE